MHISASYTPHFLLSKHPKQELTSAGFFGLEAGVPGLPPFLMEEQKEVDGPEQRHISVNLKADKAEQVRFLLTRLTFIVRTVTAARGPEPFHPVTSCTNITNDIKCIHKST